MQAVAGREHHVQDDEVVVVLEGSVEPDPPIGRDVDAIALGLQAAADETGDFGFVFDDENMHGPTLAARFRRVLACPRGL